MTDTAVPVTPLRRFAHREWGELYARVRGALVTRTWRAIPLTLAAVALCATFQVVQNQSWGYQFVQNIGSVRSGDPLLLSLVRTPLSLFVPALDLPVWGALAQILLVFGIAEICLGRRKTLFLAYVATLSGTMYARLGVALGPDNPIGLPAADKHVMDTGPSAAVVGLALYVCWRVGAYWTGTAVVVAMVVEVIVKTNLAGKEHIAALLGVFVLMLVETAVRKGRRGGQDFGEGAPPIQS
ncbi:hypothetical protein GCM10010329_13500 [Streptomyces spiroverticillatus]|uniref:Uncharacterized protein n=1 Tax=Streptomyces finlayi TaxID=67296 RepID=A0A918WX14_9ACTN|nr:hypothetical protein [Streptomyces finlayi]GGZ93720.1 hypothetical protein GCM10010329_13500 [Streptomyces spiroverticillatus]GHC92104.1 hypothetical protein GCM10010334_27600 [Streptomyces finlayi]